MQLAVTLLRPSTPTLAFFHSYNRPEVVRHTSFPFCVFFCLTFYPARYNLVIPSSSSIRWYFNIYRALCCQLDTRQDHVAVTDQENIALDVTRI